MITSYMFPFYRSPYFVNYAYPFPGNYIGYYGGYASNNIIGSAIANQNMNVIGVGAIGGTQIATPTVIW